MKAPLNINKYIMNTKTIDAFVEEAKNISKGLRLKVKILEYELGTSTKEELNNIIKCCLDTMKQATYQIDNALEIIEHSMPF